MARHGSLEEPRALRAWLARQRAAAAAPDITLSLTRLVDAEVWMPLAPTGAHALLHAGRSAGLGRLIVLGAQLPGAAGASLIERSVRARAARASVTLAPGAEAAASARELLGPGADVRDVGLAPTWDDPHAEDAERTDVRRALALPPAARVLLVPAHLGATRVLRTLLEGAARAARTLEDGLTPVLLAPDGFATLARARDARGAGPGVRVLGPTRDLGTVLAGADAIAVADEPSRALFLAGAGGSGGGAPVVAAARRRGVPLAIRAGALGSSTVGERDGAVVPAPTPEAWAAAITRCLELAAGRAGIHAAAASGTPAAFVDRIEGVLRELGERGGRR